MVRRLALPIAIPREALADFCRRNHVRKLSLFGSVLTSRFRRQSDVDVLVEFDPDRTPGLLRLPAMERELASMLGRRVDIQTPEDLSSRFRDEVVRSAAVHDERL